MSTALHDGLSLTRQYYMKKGIISILLIHCQMVRKTRRQGRTHWRWTGWCPHMAIKMHNWQGNAVTVLENEQIRCKAYTWKYWDAAHEMGAFYLSRDYEPVVQLL
eukprot:scpid92840/ scgid8634/ 